MTCSGSDWHVQRSNCFHEAVEVLRDEQATLDACNLRDGDTLTLKPGRLPPKVRTYSQQQASAKSWQHHCRLQSQFCVVFVLPRYIHVMYLLHACTCGVRIRIHVCLQDHFHIDLFLLPSGDGLCSETYSAVTGTSTCKYFVV